MHDNSETEVKSLFAQTRVEGRALIATLRGPNIAQRESEIISEVLSKQIEVADDVF